MKLQTKLTIIFSLLIALLLLLLSFSAYSYTRNLLSQRIESEIAATTASQVNKLNGWLVSKAKMLEIVGGTIRTTADQATITVPMVSGFQHADPEISDLYFGSADGPIVDGKGWQAPADFDSRTRSWYKAAVNANAIVFGDPYLDKVTNKMALPVALPLKDANGKVRGVLSEDILLQTMMDTIKSINPYDTGYAFLLDQKGTLLVHPDEQAIGKNIAEADQLKDIKASWNDMQSADHGFFRGEINGHPALLAYQKIPVSGWILAIQIPADKAYAQLTELRWLFACGTIIAIFVVAITTLFVSRRITRPIELLSKQVSQLAAGNLTVQAEHSSEDEIGHLAGDFNKMAGYLRNLIKKVQMQSQQLAAASEELTASSDQSAQASQQVTQSVTLISEQTVKQTAAAAETSGIIETMANRIKEISGNAEQVALHSQQTKSRTKNSSAALNKAVAQMNHIEKTVNTSSAVVVKLSERSVEIGQIIEAIASIAGQTNLLALNAAIEAARAGEQGRGFAVVAEEVRKLAEQSQAAAKKIAELIGSVQADTAQAVQAMQNGTNEVLLGTKTINEAGDSFQEISELLDQQSDQVEKISEAIQHIETGTRHIVGLVKNMDDFSQKSNAGLQHVAATTQEQLASTEEIAHASADLAQLAQELQTVITEFKV